MTHGILAANIAVGDHVYSKIFGLTYNLDDVLCCLLAALVFVVLGLVLRARVTAGVPGKMQLAYETIVGAVTKQVETSMGDKGLFVVPLACTLFMFILLCNWLEMIPSNLAGRHTILVSPTGDINLPLAMALTVIIVVHFTWIRLHGLKSYLGHYFKPYKVLAPINFIEEMVKPLTLALRLFGNIFAGGILITLIAAFPPSWILPTPALDFVWKLFDGFFVAPVQAFIFSLLTVIYMQSAVTGGH
ncbi:MAG: F0F1 ATP synthase subunit A [Acidimicrobiales bacterium]